MRLPGFKRILDTDYANEYKQLIQQLSSSINIGFDVLYEALNRKVSVKDNIYCTSKSIDVIVNSSGLPVSRTTLTLDTGSAKVEDVIVSRVQNLTNTSSYPIGGVTISFTQESDLLIINHITGLSANNLYRIRIIAFAN